MSESKLYNTFEGFNIRSLGDAMVLWFREKQNMQAEALEAPNGLFIQAKSPDSWKNYVGMSQAIQVQLLPTGNQITVLLGQGKWQDKAMAAGAGAIIFSPLLITAAIGSWNQSKLPAEIHAFIDNYMMTCGKVSSSVSTANLLKDDETRCKCGIINKKSTKFCVNCGQKMSTDCPKCNNPIQPNAKFCGNCGANFTENSKKMCSKCNTEVPPDNKFCPNCGNKVE